MCNLCVAGAVDSAYREETVYTAWGANITGWGDQWKQHARERGKIVIVLYIERDKESMFLRSSYYILEIRLENDHCFCQQ